MKHLAVFLFISLFLGVNQLHAQQTVGLFLNTNESYNGYTLFTPLSNKNTYLINNCGEKVHSWSSSYRPGQSVYLLEDGNLLRTGNANNSVFNAGGTGGAIEILNWESEVTWKYIISSEVECQHHDVEPLPNGNILALVWDLKTKSEASAAGRSTSGNTLWSEKIIEIQPDLENGGGTIVWEWKVWDHLVQDMNESLPNYGTIAESPQLIDINYANNAMQSDWLHCNSIDYNEKLDQIVISNHNFSEIWIIDHSTTTDEAASHSGGNAGRGGDLLYRWGNPETYDQGSSADRKLFLQHDANWIDETHTDGGMIMVFNNQPGGGANYSTIDVIDTPVDSDGQYNYSGASYAPDGFQWTYKASNPSDFFASNISGARRLPNGNTLICEGPSGTFFEVDYSGNMVWKYVNPVAGSGILHQGDAATKNLCFRAERYASNYPGLEGKSLSSQGYIETGSTFTCELETSIDAEMETSSIHFYPNPASNQINCFGNEVINSIFIIDLNGKKLYETTCDQKEISLDLSFLNNGVYFFQVTSSERISILERISIKK